MATFLIDYENIGVHGLDGIDKLTEKDSIYIFYTDNANKLTFDLHHEITEAKAKVKYMKVGNGGNNALDFQLVSYLGWLIKEHPGEDFFIVSKDKGFNCMQKFWAKEKRKVNSVLNLSGKNITEIILKLGNELEEILDSKELNIVVGYIVRYKTKQGVNNALVKRFGSTKAGEVYKKLKPFISDKG